MRSPSEEQQAKSASHVPSVSLPYLTVDLPGVGGRLKHSPEDFVVEELPAYTPSGSGEHLFLWIEKHNVGAEDLVRHISRTLDIARTDIGVAGMKDRRAVTRQYVSVPARVGERFQSLDTDNIRVLDSSLHQNKLRTGHLRGNRFAILVRDVSPDALELASATAARINDRGVPNYYGEQRFGIDHSTLQTGMELLTTGRMPSRRGPRNKFLTRLAISAVQSSLFNELLAERIREGKFGKVIAGDVMQVVASGGLFVAEDVGTEQARCSAQETVVTGPMFGPKMRMPSSEPARRESAALDRVGLSVESFARFGNIALGTRRPYTIWPQELECRQEAEGLRLFFSLPAGAYATVVLREFMKADTTD